MNKKSSSSKLKVFCRKASLKEAFLLLFVLSKDIYQNRQEIYGAAEQFMTDIQQERYRDDELLEANVS